MQIKVILATNPFSPVPYANLQVYIRKDKADNSFLFLDSVYYLQIYTRHWNYQGVHLPPYNDLSILQIHLINYFRCSMILHLKLCLMQ